MASLKHGLGGRGTSMTVDSSERHPSSHYEMGEMNIKKAHDGSFVMRHEMRLKKRHAGKAGFESGYMSEHPEPETHTAADGEELMKHVGKHFGVKAKAKEEEEPEEEGGEEGEGESGEEE